MIFHHILWGKSPWQNGLNAASKRASSNSSRAITFIFGLITLEKVSTSLSQSSTMGYYHYSSRRLALVLNNP